jgi:hypothetical protein
MVRIKHTARPINIRVSFEAESMTSDGALEVSTLRREASAEATPSWSLEDFDDCESRSGDSEGSETASNDSERLKVAAVVAAVAGITCDFSVCGVMKA